MPAAALVATASVASGMDFTEGACDIDEMIAPCRETLRNRSASGLGPTLRWGAGRDDDPRDSFDATPERLVLTGRAESGPRPPPPPAARRPSGGLNSNGHRRAVNPGAAVPPSRRQGSRALPIELMARGGFDNADPALPRLSQSG